MTQNEQVLKFLKNGGELTSLQAVRKMGVTRLAARIHELRQEGYEIADRTITVQTRGGTTQVSQYYIPKGQRELAL